MKILINERLSEHRCKTPEGYLICTDAILARTGKQTYRKNEIFKDSDDETEIEVDRTEDEVFSPQTLASFENKPVTVEHPDEDVNVHNYKEYAVGFVRDVHRGDVNGQPVILGNLVITDEQTIQEIENGEHTDLSCGYDCDIADEANPCQRNIRGNHVALCECGRAGIARIVDSTHDANHLPAKVKRDLQKFLNHKSTFIRNKDYDISEFVKEFERVSRLWVEFPLKIVRESIKGWFKTGDGMMRKDYEFSIEGYDDRFMVSLYAKPDTYETTELNAYFTDSVKDRQSSRLGDKVRFRNRVYVIIKVQKGKSDDVARLTLRPLERFDEKDKPFEGGGDSYWDIHIERWQLDDSKCKDSFDIEFDLGFRKTRESYNNRKDADERYDELIRLSKKPSMRGMTVKKLYDTIHDSTFEICHIDNDDVQYIIDESPVYAVKAKYENVVLEWYVRANSEREAFDKVKRQPGHNFDTFVSAKIVKERAGMRIIDESPVYDALIPPTKEAINKFESLLRIFDIKIDRKGLTPLGRVHYQVRANMEFDRFVKRLERIDGEMDELGIPMTFNAGSDGNTCTAGIDLDKQYVKDSQRAQKIQKIIKVVKSIK